MFTLLATIQKRMRRRYAAGTHGFTLIELLVVILIIAILVLLLILAINPREQQGKVHDITRKRDLNNLKGFYERFFLRHSRYPVDSEVCYDEAVDIGGGVCSCHVCGLEEDVGTFKDLVSLLYCDPTHPNKSYVYQYDCSDSPGWYKMYAELAQEDDEGACSYGVTNRSEAFLEPYPNECELDEEGGGEEGGGESPTATPSPPSCPSDPTPKYCILGSICNICGSLANCQNPANCNQPLVLYDDSLCTNQCQ